MYDELSPQDGVVLLEELNKLLDDAAQAKAERLNKLFDVAAQTPRLKELSPPVIRQPLCQRRLRPTLFRRLRLIHRYGPFCIYCDRILTIETSTSDHILPKSKGGTNRMDNLALSCQVCNLRKGNSTLTTLEMIAQSRQKRAHLKKKMRFILGNLQEQHRIVFKGRTMAEIDEMALPDLHEHLKQLFLVVSKQHSLSCACEDLRFWYIEGFKAKYYRWYLKLKHHGWPSD